MRAVLAAAAVAASLAAPVAASPQDCVTAYLGAGYTVRPPRYGVRPAFVDVTPTAYTVKEVNAEARDLVTCAT